MNTAARPQLYSSRSSTASTRSALWFIALPLRLGGGAPCSFEVTDAWTSSPLGRWNAVSYSRCVSLARRMTRSRPSCTGAGKVRASSIARVEPTTTCCKPLRSLTRANHASSPNRVRTRVISIIAYSGWVASSKSISSSKSSPHSRNGRTGNDTVGSPE